MVSLMPIIQIRILDLRVLSEDPEDFQFDGLYMVARVGTEAHRTFELTESSESTWNEVLTFHPSESDSGPSPHMTASLDTIELELWRALPDSDHCLAAYQFCIPTEKSTEGEMVPLRQSGTRYSDVMDKVVNLVSPSLYATHFAVRVRVGVVGTLPTITHSDPSASNYVLPSDGFQLPKSTPPVFPVSAKLPMNGPVLWQL